VPGTVGLHSDR